MQRELNRTIADSRSKKVFKAYKVFIIFTLFVVIVFLVFVIFLFKDWPDADRCNHLGECGDSNVENNQPIEGISSNGDKHDDLEVPLSSGFDYPVGTPDAEGFHNLQGFGVNNHLGEDWNDLGYCDSDLGKSVSSISEGYVSFAKDVGGGWGNVVRIIHKVPSDNPEGYRYVESLYAHLARVDVKEGQKVGRDEVIGTIGNVNGRYCAHLHFELRETPGLDLGGGYSASVDGFLNPSEYIEENRNYN